MTDLPADTREQLVAGMLPPLLTEVRRLETDKGDTIKFLWRLHDGRPGRVGAHALPPAASRCACRASRLRHELPVLRDRTGGADPQHVDRRDHRADRRANRLIAEGGLGGKKSDDHSMERVSNIVFMGMGEPLANYKRVMDAVRSMVARSPTVSA